MSFRQPFKGDYPITLDFGEPCDGLYKPGEHKGIDFGCPIGTEILASDDGYIIFTGTNPKTYGQYIVISHGNGYVTYYAHLSERKVKQDQHVEKGEVIGLSGSTGNSTGPHLHFEVHSGSAVIDPKTVLQNVFDADPNTYTPEPEKPEFEHVQSGFCVVVCDVANVRCHCDMSRVIGTRQKGDVIAVGDEITIWNGLPYRDYYDPTYKCWLRIAEHDPWTQIIKNTEIF